MQKQKKEKSQELEEIFSHLLPPTEKRSVEG